MADNLFEGLPPPSAAPPPSSDKPSASSTKMKDSASPPALAPAKAPVPAPALKSALKRDKSSNAEGDAPQKRLRFKTNVDATEKQVIEAMQKIALHIKSPSKFSKASKLAMQLIEAGSIKSETSNQFFAILEAAMSLPSACNDPSLRADYQTLFSAVQDLAEYFNKQQKNKLTTWTLRAVVVNDLHTDDSFVYSKAAGKIKEVISNLPVASVEDDNDEATALKSVETKMVGEDISQVASTASCETDNDLSDPFKLDALLQRKSKKDESKREMEAAALNKKTEDEEYKRFIRSQREVLLLCLEIAARRYKIPWAQTVIDILVKHAFDNIHRFTRLQRDAIEKLWVSIKEQHVRRKQGKSVSGKLDVNSFEWLQEKYSHEKISIRHTVGGGGERHCEQWLG